MDATYRATCRTQLTKLCNSAKEFLADTSEETTKQETHVFIQRLKACSDRLKKADEAIKPTVKAEDMAKEFESVMEYEDRAVTLIAQLEFMLLEKNSKKPNDSHREEKHEPASDDDFMGIRLRAIELKQFDGNFENWLPFWEQFKRVVHNNNKIPPTTKFSYLSQSLIGNAAMVITGFTPSEKCYDDAIALLQEQYGNSEKIVEKYVQKLLEIKSVQSPSDFKGLRSLYNEVIATRRTLSALEIAPLQYSIVIKSIILRCLPAKLRIDFHKTDKRSNLMSLSSATVIDSNKSEDLENLLEYIKIEVEALEKAKMSETESMRGIEPSGAKKTIRGTAVGFLTNSISSEKQCLFCKSPKHNTHQCDSDLSIEQRKLILKREGRCFRCTGKNHTSKFCKSQWIKCGRCKGRHLTSLCEDQFPHAHRNKQNETSSGKAHAGDKSNSGLTTAALNDHRGTATLSAANDSNKEIFLQTAKAILCNENNKKLLTRVIMDNGSQKTYISEKVAEELDLPIIGEEISRILTFGETKNKKLKKLKKVKLNVKSQYNNTCIQIVAIVVPTICADILPVPDVQNFNFSGIELAEDIVCNENLVTGINMLIGQDNFWKFNLFECKLIKENLVAVKTFFGWTIQGGSNENSESNYVFNTLYEREEEFDLSQFWSLEAIGITPEKCAPTSNVEIKLVNGRYEVSLPWKMSAEALSNNKNNATNRLKALTRKLMHDRVKLVQYHNGVQELIDNGIAERVIHEKSENRVYYMPHRPVYRDNKLTTKMRIVFDASASEPGLLSLNDHLSSGENLVADLLETMIRFRSNKIALTADIEKAFLQVALREQDRDSHRFLWYEALPCEPDKLPNIVEYHMNRVTFGVTSSPYLLAATIKTHLELMEPRYGTICKKLEQSFYVDDLVCSVQNQDEAENIIDMAKVIFSAANFNLRKWSTNYDCIRHKFSIDDIAQPLNQKVLGLNWCTANDQISVDLCSVTNLMQNLRATKRNITRAMARVYDPLGMLGPFTVRIKLLLQDVWKQKVDWDQTLSDELANRFLIWEEEITVLINMVMPRCIADDGLALNHLHIFADASPRAYGAVAYLRSVQIGGVIQTRFICSKNRVSPLTNTNENELTLPKLELTAALMGARLKKFILNCIDLKISTVNLWTDSMITLNWIKGDSKGIKPYITSRVKEINSLTNVYEWRHCKGSLNPADLLTRGMKAKNLLHSELWKKGPAWLSEPEDEWPVTEICFAAMNANQVSVKSFTEREPILDIEKFSKLKRLIRTTAYVLRYVRHLKEELARPIKRAKTKNLIKTVEELSAEELREAEMYWVEQQQRQFFSEEITSLQKMNEVPKTSKIVSLNPTLINNTLRVNTRLPITSDVNECGTISSPIILPKKSWFCYLLIQEAHVVTLHGGVNMVLTYLRQTYWIIQGRQLVKSVLNRCVICKRLRGKSGSEPWVTLPVERIRLTEPFDTSGIDFAGPLYTKETNSEVIKKSYIMLITCASSRAVHLELVMNLSVKSCIEAIRRFIARRGVPSVIMSDNAKSFKRADKEIAKLFQIMEEPDIRRSTAHKTITWKYIPERAAWWGGFWERLVRVVKTAIKASIGKELLSHDELATFLTEVESVVNSRPLTYVSSDEKDLEPLTPAHFLHRANSVLPNSNFNFTIDQSSLSRSWQLRQTLMKRYVKRWHSEYIAQLRSIHHNTSGISRSIKPGDIVLLQEDFKSRLLWKMAIVETVYPGRDGRIRSCDVRLANRSILKRPIQLLVPLEISSSMAGAKM